MMLRPDRHGLRLAAELPRAGEFCAFPAETVYGLRGNALSEPAVSEIYWLKGRPSWSPLIAHLKNERSARPLAKTWPMAARNPAAEFWPGPLTLVVEGAADTPPYVNVRAPTIAIRVPLHRVALALLDQCDLQRPALSANRSEQLSRTCPEHVVASLPAVRLVIAEEDQP